MRRPGTLPRMRFRFRVLALVRPVRSGVVQLQTSRTAQRSTPWYLPLARDARCKPVGLIIAGDDDPDEQTAVGIMATFNRFARAALRRVALLRAKTALAVKFARTPVRRIIVLWLRDHYRFGPYLLAAIARRQCSVEVVEGSAYTPSAATLRRMRVGMISVSASRLNALHS